MTIMRLVVVSALVVACGEQSSNSHGEPVSQSPATVAVADAVLIVPGERVGEFVIGRQNATSIWEYKKSRANAQFAMYTVGGPDYRLGPELQFELGSGGVLDGVLVQSAEYMTAEGLRVGTLATDIEAALGAPRARLTERDGEVDVHVLDYEGIAFVIDSGRVKSIRVRGA